MKKSVFVFVAALALVACGGNGAYAPNPSSQEADAGGSTSSASSEETGGEVDETEPVDEETETEAPVPPPVMVEDEEEEDDGVDFGGNPPDVQPEPPYVAPDPVATTPEPVPTPELDSDVSATANTVIIVHEVSPPTIVTVIVPAAEETPPVEQGTSGIACAVPGETDTDGCSAGKERECASNRQWTVCRTVSTPCGTCANPPPAAEPEPVAEPEPPVIVPPSNPNPAYITRAECEASCGDRGVECGYAQAVSDLFCSEFCAAYVLKDAEAECLLSISCVLLPDLLDETLRENHVEACEAEEAPLPSQTTPSPVVGDPQLSLGECLDDCLAYMASCHSLITEDEGDLYCAVVCAVFDPRESELDCALGASCQEMVDTASLECFDEYNDPPAPVPPPTPPSTVYDVEIHILDAVDPAAAAELFQIDPWKVITCRMGSVRDPVIDSMVNGVICEVSGMDLSKPYVFGAHVDSQQVSGYPIPGSTECVKFLRAYARKRGVVTPFAEYDNASLTSYRAMSHQYISQDQGCHITLPATL